MTLLTEEAPSARPVQGLPHTPKRISGWGPRPVMGISGALVLPRPFPTVHLWRIKAGTLSRCEQAGRRGFTIFMWNWINQTLGESSSSREVLYNEILLCLV